MSDISKELEAAIAEALIKVEEEGNIVITNPIIREISSVIAEKVQSVYAGGLLSVNEFYGICSLISHAVEDKMFYDREMPTLIGYTASEMKDIGFKLRKCLNI